MRRGAFSDSVKAAVMARAGGACEVRLPGVCIGHGVEYHHRRPRGLGGSRAADTGSAANCLLLCGACHRWCEANREEARYRGWLVPQGADPAATRVWRGMGLDDGRWVLLGATGGLEPWGVAS